ncbi:MAG: DUF4956 domain-containing protein [Candidatus Marinimicrobia bacterium]|nr:DUF4956 domain-containing protein [FCB group bacterium]MBL7025863.1 DUF4956 domain-containing protein [Candidatus Neomarinimicrobiota bacterium]
MQLFDLQSLMDMNIRTGDVLLNLLVAFLCGLVIAQTYKMTFGGASYSKSISNSLVVLAMITTVVIIVIGNNLARAFGLVGAMSIIRFRTAVKDPMDIVFIFFSLTIGLAAGVGLAQIAIIGTLSISAVLLVMSKIGYGSHRSDENLLQFAYSGDHNGGEPPYIDVIKTHCRSYTMVNVRSLGSSKQYEISYYVTLRQTSQGNEFVKELSGLEDVDKINLYSDESLSS